MELGNIIDGNSRGEYSLNNSEAFRRELIRLFDTYAPGQDNSYGERFENETFFVFPYYWGECTCGWEQHDNGHERINSTEHSNTCYQEDYWKLHEKVNAMYYKKPRDQVREYERKEIIKLYQKHNLEIIGDDPFTGCGVRCSCDYEERINAVLEEYSKEFGHNGHKPECLLLKDNFFYKPTGFAIQWYKYPLRDAYMNQNISLQEFRTIIDNCIKSIGGETISDIKP
jgi:hypothetical protein